MPGGRPTARRAFSPKNTDEANHAQRRAMVTTRKDQEQVIVVEDSGDKAVDPSVDASADLSADVPAGSGAGGGAGPGSPLSIDADGGAPEQKGCGGGDHVAIPIEGTTPDPDEAAIEVSLAAETCPTAQSLTPPAKEKRLADSTAKEPLVPKPNAEEPETKEPLATEESVRDAKKRRDSATLREEAEGIFTDVSRPAARAAARAIADLHRCPRYRCADARAALCPRCRRSLSKADDALEGPGTAEREEKEPLKEMEHHLADAKWNLADLEKRFTNIERLLAYVEKERVRALPSLAQQMQGYLEAYQGDVCDYYFVDGEWDFEGLEHDLAIHRGQRAAGWNMAGAAITPPPKMMKRVHAP